jgi:tRNA (guanosine-2'-O-)-methyltransferase
LSLILDNLNSPYNVGSVSRTAAAYKVDHVWFTGATPGFEHPGSRKTALGTDRYLTSSATTTGMEAVDQAHQQGYVVVAIELTSDAVPLFALESALGPRPDKPQGDDICLVVGHEDHGVHASTLRACDRVAYLPLAGKVGSLNVAVAAAVAIAEVRRWAWQHHSEEIL